MDDFLEIVQDDENREDVGLLYPKTDYKFKRIVVENGTIVEAVVKFYEGFITTEDDGEGLVTRYRRREVLTKNKLGHLKNKQTVEQDDSQFVFTATDFGVISDVNDLRTHLDAENKKDVERSKV